MGDRQRWQLQRAAQRQRSQEVRQIVSQEDLGRSVGVKYGIVRLGPYWGRNTQEYNSLLLIMHTVCSVGPSRTTSVPSQRFRALFVDGTPGENPSLQRESARVRARHDNIGYSPKRASRLSRGMGTLSMTLEDDVRSPQPCSASSRVALRERSCGTDSRNRMRQIHCNSCRRVSFVEVGK